MPNNKRVISLPIKQQIDPQQRDDEENHLLLTHKQPKDLLSESGSDEIQSTEVKKTISSFAYESNQSARHNRKKSRSPIRKRFLEQGSDS